MIQVRNTKYDNGLRMSDFRNCAGCGKHVRANDMIKINVNSAIGFSLCSKCASELAVKIENSMIGV